MDIEESGSSVIDNVVTNKKAIEEVKKVDKGNRTESDHVPLEVELEDTERIKRERVIQSKWKKVYEQKKGLSNTMEDMKDSHAHRTGRFEENQKKK